MTDRLGSIDSQYFDGSGAPLVAGKLYFYESGTTTPKNTFKDINETIANTNPVILSGAGVPPNIFFTGAAKVILTDSDSVQLRVMDPVGGTASGAFSDWDATSIYAVNDLVLGSNGKYYKGLSTENVGNDPVTTSGKWARAQFNETWDNGAAYDIDDIVQGSNGLIYVSLTNTNQGNDPTTDVVNWGNGSDSDYSFLSKAVVSNDATVDFTLPAGYSRYIFQFDSVSTGAGADTMYMRTSTDGGATFDASGYGYSFTTVDTDAVTAVTAGYSAAQISLTSSHITVSGIVEVFSPSSALDCNIIFRLAGERSAGTKNSNYSGMGVRLAAADVDAVRFLQSTGSIATGTIRMYGVR